MLAFKNSREKKKDPLVLAMHESIEEIHKLNLNIN